MTLNSTAKNWKKILQTKTQKNPWILSFSILIGIIYFIILALYIVHHKQFSPLLISFIVLIAFLIIIPIFFIERYNYLFKKMLNLRFNKDSKNLHFHFIKYSQYEVLVWLIINNALCLALFIISNFLALTISNMEKYFTSGFIYLFFISSTLEWLGILWSWKNNKGLMSFAFVLLNYTYDTQRDLLVDLSNFTLITTASGWKYNFIYKALNATYWVTNFMWIYLISELIAAASDAAVGNAIIIPIADLLCYLWPYMFLFFVHGSLEKERSAFAQYKIIHIENHTQDFQIYKRLLNLRFFLTNNGPFYKRHNIVYWEFNVDSADWKPGLPRFNPLHMYYQADFVYFENLSDGHVNAFVIDELNRSGELDNQLSKLSLQSLDKKNKLFYCNLNKWSTIKFLVTAKKYQALSNRSLLIKQLFFRLKQQFFMVYDETSNQFKLLKGQEVDQEVNNAYTSINISESDYFHKVVKEYYKLNVKTDIAPLTFSCYDDLPQQAYVCHVHQWSNFFIEALNKPSLKAK